MQGYTDIYLGSAVGDTYTMLCAGSVGPTGTKKDSKLVRTLLWLCGMERRQENPEDVAPAKPEHPMASLEENPLVKHILNINLILSICAGVFLWAYFA